MTVNIRFGKGIPIFKSRQEVYGESMERIIGIGIDQIEIQRILDACARESFVKRLFSEEECELISKRKSMAATNFAGKEAVSKALGTGFIGISPSEIMILRKESGAPYVKLTGKAEQTARQLGITKIHISLTDSQTMALAYVVAVGEEE